MPVGTSITARSGRDFLLKVSDGTSPTTFNTVGGLRNVSLTLNNNPVDVTNVSSGGFREYMADGGVQSASLSGDGIFDSATVGAALLWQAARSRTLVGAEGVSGHGDRFVGAWAVTSYRRGGTFDGAETFTVAMESHGELVYEA